MSPAQITFGDLKPNPRAAILASCLTRAGNENNPTEWGTLLTLEGHAHEELSDQQRRAFAHLDLFLTALARTVSTEIWIHDRRRALPRLLALA